MAVRVKVFLGGRLICWNDLGSSAYAREYEGRMHKLGYATEREATAPRPESPSKPSESHRGNIFILMEHPPMPPGQAPIPLRGRERRGGHPKVGIS